MLNYLRFDHINMYVLASFIVGDGEFNKAMRTYKECKIDFRTQNTLLKII